MIAVCLFVALTSARVLAMWGRSIDASAWMPIALIWQDVAVAVVFWGFTRVVSATVARAGYSVLVVYAAITVPIERALSSPLTMTMLRATSGTISDSIGHYVTTTNVACVALVLVAGAAAPFAMARLRPAFSKRTSVALLTSCASIVAVGPLASTRADTAGFDRNPVLALARSALPRVSGAADHTDWRVSPFGGTPAEDLSSVRGAAAGRNVLFVVLESTAARYLRAYGAPDDPTPNLTALAESALVFDHAYTGYPESVKGMVAYLASRFPAFDVSAELHANAMSPSLATILGAQGYSTALVHSGRFMYLGMEALLSRSGFTTLLDAGDIGGSRNSSFGVDERAAVDALLRWMDAQPRGKPFFAAYLPIAGHHPYLAGAPGPWRGDADIDRYRNALHEGDEAIGRLIGGLRARGLDRSTLLVIFGDHGEAFGQHQGNYAHTLALYDENVRVPLMFVLPGDAPVTRRVSRTASLVDVAPTVLDLMGLESPSGFQGASLLAPTPRMALFFTDYSLGLLGLRDGCTKYIYEMESDRSRMFDVCRDPDERDDIASTSGSRSAQYRELLKRWSAAQVGRVTSRTP
jgi:phosphoglycerol transferase MdoB-like AlkP superfamily enzyme